MDTVRHAAAYGEDPRNRRLDLILFTTDVDFALQAEAAGIDGIMVDWETLDKPERQRGYATQINRDTPEDVGALSSRLGIPVWVRINRLGDDTGREIDVALEHGAVGLMLPMAAHPRDVEQFLTLVDGRARTLVQIETQPLVDHCAELRALPWDAAYIGLNDLMISRRSTWIWEAVADGTVETIFETLHDRQVGFGGVTVVGGGEPMRFVSLLREMARLGCGMSFLRRTFWKEVPGRDVAAEIRAVRAVWDAALRRGPEAVEADRAAFHRMLHQLHADAHRIDV